MTHERSILNNVNSALNLRLLLLLLSEKIPFCACRRTGEWLPRLLLNSSTTGRSSVGFIEPIENIEQTEIDISSNISFLQKQSNKGITKVTE